MTVNLTEQEWNQLINILSDVQASWRVINPLLVQIIHQVREQQMAQAPPITMPKAYKNLKTGTTDA